MFIKVPWEIVGYCRVYPLWLVCTFMACTKVKAVVLYVSGNRTCLNCLLLFDVTEFDGAVKRLFRKTKNLEQRPLEGPNTYIVTLWDLPTWTEVDIVIDERLPVMGDGSGKLLASRPSEDGELW
jgi:hypothetical protein